MKALVLALAIALSPLTAMAQTNSTEDGKGELWGKSDRGEDKGRVQAGGSPYNTTHIAYAAVIIVLMGVLLVWIIRRQTRDDGESNAG